MGRWWGWDIAMYKDVNAVTLVVFSDQLEPICLGKTGLVGSCANPVQTFAGVCAAALVPGIVARASPRAQGAC